jgi:hypothetical protein
VTEGVSPPCSLHLEVKCNKRVAVKPSSGQARHRPGNTPVTAAGVLSRTYPKLFFVRLLYFMQEFIAGLRLYFMQEFIAGLQLYFMQEFIAGLRLYFIQEFIAGLQLYFIQEFIAGLQLYFMQEFIAGLQLYFMQEGNESSPTSALETCADFVELQPIK